MLRRALFALALAALIRAQDPLPTPSDAEVRSAIEQAVKLLVGFQENYVETEPPRRRFKSAEDQKKWEQAYAEEMAAKGAKLGPPREWPYEGVYRVGGLIPPGYRVGGTAISCWALLEAPGFEKDAKRAEAFGRGISFVLESLEKDPLLQSGFEGSYDVRGWAHAYGLRALLRALERGVLDADTAKRATAMVNALVKALAATEIPESGGWNYARSGPNEPCPPSTFMTAPTLQALFEAKRQGFDVPEPMLHRGLRSLDSGRLTTGAFQYGTSDRKSGKGFEAVPGACARMAVCETTLYLAGQGSIDRIRAAVDAFFEHWQWLEKRRKKQGTHVAPYMIAPYYFHYAHTYVAQAIEQLPEKERPPLRGKLRALYWLTREKGGGWNDRMFPRSEGYGTAMAILGLMMPELPPPARYDGGTTTRTK